MKMVCSVTEWYLKLEKKFSSLICYAGTVCGHEMSNLMMKSTRLIIQTSFLYAHMTVHVAFCIEVKPANLAAHKHCSTVVQWLAPADALSFILLYY